MQPNPSYRRHTLRDYQQRALDELRSGILAGYRRPLLVAPTGAGKTSIAAELIRLATARGRRILFLAHRTELIEQCSERLDGQGVDHGIIKANHWRRKPHHQVHVASVPTLVNRQLSTPPDIIIIDECHRARSDSYQHIIDRYPQAVIIGLTATPIRTDGKGLGNIFNVMVQCPSVAALTAMGHLVPTRVFAPSKPDLTGVKKTAGDFNQQGIQNAMNRPTITGDIVATWKRLASDRITVLFATGIEHSLHLRDAFLAAGISAEHLDGDTEADRRRKLLADLAAGRIRVLCSVGVLTEGWDSPGVSCAILARPTASTGLYLQMCLDRETEILTKDGWKSHQTLDNNDLIAAFDKATSRINWEKPLGVVRRPIGEQESYCSIDSPHLNIRVTDQHSMVYRAASRTAKNWHTRTAADLGKLRVHFRLPVSGYQNCEGVPLRDCEISFLGWFLSDGTLNKTNNAICISQAENSPSIGFIEQCLKECGFKYGRHVSVRKGKLKGYPAIVQFTVSKGKPRLRDLHLSGWERIGRYIDKEVADSLFEMNHRQVGVLLDAINLGDGHKGRCSWIQKTMRISTGNRRYADRLQALCVVSGYRCNISTHHYNKSPLYVLAICKKESAVVGGQLAEEDRSRLVFSPSDGELVWCVETQSGAIVTRRRDKVAIVGNCGRILRPAPGKSDALLLDHAGCTLAHGFVDDDREWTLDVDRPTRPRLKIDLSLPKVCPDCFRVATPATRVCECGYVFAVSEREMPRVVDGELEEITNHRKYAGIPQSRRKDLYFKWVREGTERGYKAGYAGAKWKAMFKEPIPTEWMLEASLQHREYFRSAGGAA